MDLEKERIARAERVERLEKAERIATQEKTGKTELTVLQEGVKLLTYFAEIKYLLFIEIEYKQEL